MPAYKDQKHKGKTPWYVKFRYDQFKTRLKLVLEVAIFTQTMSPTYFEDTVKAMSHYDDFIVCRKGQLFDI